MLQVVDLIHMQEIIIGILFLGALFFIGRMIWRQYTAKEGCEGCHSCDVSKATKEPEPLPEIK